MPQNIRMLNCNRQNYSSLRDLGFTGQGLKAEYRRNLWIRVAAPSLSFHGNVRGSNVNGRRYAPVAVGIATATFPRWRFPL